MCSDAALKPAVKANPRVNVNFETFLQKYFNPCLTANLTQSFVNHFFFHSLNRIFGNQIRLSRCPFLNRFSLIKDLIV